MLGKKLPLHFSIQLFLKENPWDLLWLKNQTFKWCCLILGSVSHHCQSEVKSMQFAVLTFHDWIQILYHLLSPLGKDWSWPTNILKPVIFFLHLTAYWLKQIQWLRFKLFVNFDATRSCFVSRWSIWTWCIMDMNWDGKGFLHPCSKCTWCFIKTAIHRRQGEGNQCFSFNRMAPLISVLASQ